MTGLPDLNTLLDAMVADLAGIEGVRDCGRTGGRFDVGELQRFALKAPAVRVAALGIRGVRTVDTGECDATVQVGAFVVTRDAPGQGREAAVLQIVGRIIVRAELGRWGLVKVHPARELAAESLYSGTLQKTGVAIWAVTWRQTVRIGVDDFAPIDGGIAAVEATPNVLLPELDAA